MSFSAGELIPQPLSPSNLHQLPKTGGYVWFLSLRKQYGPIISLKLGPGNVIVLQSAKVVKDLIDKKSAVYSYAIP